MILSSQKVKSRKSISNILNWLQKPIASFILIAIFSLSFLSVPFTTGNIKADAALSSDPADSVDDFYITDGDRQSFRSDFQHRIISQTILEEPTLELQTKEIPIGQANIAL